MISSFVGGASGRATPSLKGSSFGGAVGKPGDEKDEIP